jgi:hypothetical protein
MICRLSQSSQLSQSFVVLPLVEARGEERFNDDSNSREFPPDANVFFNTGFWTLVCLPSFKIYSKILSHDPISCKVEPTKFVGIFL